MNLFGTDGIRGVANADLSWETAFRLGRAVGLYLSPGRDLCVGKDTRASGDMLEAALIAGITSTGRHVTRFGRVTTPGLSYLVRRLSFGGGIMISASHNPFEYNGLKVFGPDGRKIPDETEIFFSRLILEKSDDGPFPTGSGIGRVADGFSLSDHYVEFLANIPRQRFSGLKVLLDTANGSTSDIAPRVWRQVCKEVSVINDTPDGCNINKECGSTHPEKLRRLVKEGGFDVGFAYDGDGDRCIAVDEKGQILDGDHIMAILAIWMKDAGTLKGDTVVGTVMANIGLELCLKEHGIKFVRTPVGDRYVLEEMDRGGYSLGGEQSGHVIFRDILPAGDGIITSLILADVLTSSGSRLSELRSIVPKVPQVMVNVRVSQPRAIMERERMLQAIETAQNQIGTGGRVLVRASGTEPVIRVMVESFDHAKVTRCIQYLEEVIREEEGSCVRARLTESSSG
ncbi:MAG: phosphoglucosamine mutase [Candidatus Fermentithermobacillus carboniphilus]|uniref:Phosphoglucosamine mutase n=1 Tax=Candidatus Fermentithermobacillus carboniphilus TaxID=3085328 RepID=A0AAT9LCC5_9FIRM|nr:MAG: phosphoglucosamine mutase [Candidatus Fermentithermobacillus carboniphilus]